MSKLAINIQVEIEIVAIFEDGSNLLGHLLSLCPFFLEQTGVP